MLIGYNNDVEHRGKTFHIQTEDRGQNDHKIETQLFHGGAILDTKITDYSEIVDGLEGEKRNDKIKSVMKASHQSLFKNLLAGKYDEQVGLDPVEKSEKELKQDFKDKISEFQPGRDGVPQAAVELEEEGIEALEEEAREEGFEDPAGADHQGLSSLKDRLNEMGPGEESEPETVDEMEIDLGDGGRDPADAAASTGGETRQIDVEANTDNVDTAMLDASELEFPEDQHPPEMGGLGAESTGDMMITETGVTSWTGCEEPDQDLSVTALVEQQMQK